MTQIFLEIDYLVFIPFGILYVVNYYCFLLQNFLRFLDKSFVSKCDSSADIVAVRMKIDLHSGTSCLFVCLQTFALNWRNNSTDQFLPLYFFLGKVNEFWNRNGDAGACLQKLLLVARNQLYTSVLTGHQNSVLGELLDKGLIWLWNTNVSLRVQ